MHSGRKKQTTNIQTKRNKTHNILTHTYTYRQRQRSVLFFFRVRVRVQVQQHAIRLVLFSLRKKRARRRSDLTSVQQAAYARKRQIATFEKNYARATKTKRSTTTTSKGDSGELNQNKSENGAAQQQRRQRQQRSNAIECRSQRNDANGNAGVSDVCYGLQAQN